MLCSMLKAPALTGRSIGKHSKEKKKERPLATGVERRGVEVKKKVMFREIKCRQHTEMRRQNLQLETANMLEETID